MTNGNKFSFYPFSPRIWNGRYRVTKAEENTFHIKYSKTKGEWWPFILQIDDEYTAESPALDNGDVRELVDQINSVKTAVQGYNGGKFVINEFGQVIVPTIYYEKLLVGEIEGKIHFEDTFNGGVMDLSDARGLSSGDVWKKPYLGLVYNYDPKKGALFQEKRGAFRDFSKRQDRELNEKLYLVRGGDYCRFVVNPWGIVLTKKPPYLYGGKWESVYVGKINYDFWFDKEERAYNLAEAFK